METSVNRQIFADIFDDYDNLPIVFKKHYQNYGFCDEATKCEGIMRVYLSPLMKIGAPFLALTKTLIAKTGENIKVDVNFKSNPNDNSFTYDRVFYFNQKPQIFTSKMVPMGGSKVIEWTKSGLGWGADFYYKNGRVILSHEAYYLKIFGKLIRAPLEFLFGRANAYEIAINDDEFEMYMDITHPFFGKLYEYSGRFRMMKNV